MSYGKLNAMSFIIAMLLLFVFITTEDIFFGVTSVVLVILSAEFSILDALEKSKEGR